jgi:hypothetical protein
MSVGDIVKVQCGLEISREESNYFLKKNVKMKLFIPEKFGKLPVSKYFKLAKDYGIVVKKFVQVQFQMTAIPR